MLTATPAELLEAAVTATSGHAAQCEPLRSSGHPLDVLCQQVLGLACAETCSADDVFALVRRAYPYRDLARQDFDDCLRYLFGSDQHGEPWLPARLRGTPERFHIRDQRTARLLRRNLGTIVTEEPVAVHAEATALSPLSPRGRREQEAPHPQPLSPGGRGEQEAPHQPLSPTGRGEQEAPHPQPLSPKGRGEQETPHPQPLSPEERGEPATSATTWTIGHVDPLFAERLRPGDRFLLDGRCLELRRQDHSGLLVEEVLGRPAVPRWGGDGWPLSAELARRLFDLRRQAAEALREGPTLSATCSATTSDWQRTPRLSWPAIFSSRIASAKSRSRTCA